MPNGDGTGPDGEGRKTGKYKDNGESGKDSRRGKGLRKGPQDGTGPRSEEDRPKDGRGKGRRKKRSLTDKIKAMWKERK